MVLILDMSSNEWDDEPGEVIAERAPQHRQVVELPRLEPRLEPVVRDENARTGRYTPRS